MMIGGTIQLGINAPPQQWRERDVSQSVMPGKATDALEVASIAPLASELPREGSRFESN
jgi:hypothetical protein